jgi:DNA-binding NarL/FixJ family response regulator
MRVVIAEDSILVREGLTRLLAETGIEVAAAVGDAESFLRAAGPAIRAPESATCSRTGSATSPNSSTR